MYVCMYVCMYFFNSSDKLAHKKHDQTQETKVRLK